MREGCYTRGGLYANLSTLVEKSEFSKVMNASKFYFNLYKKRNND